MVLTLTITLHLASSRSQSLGHIPAICCPIVLPLFFRSAISVKSRRGHARWERALCLCWLGLLTHLVDRGDLGGDLKQQSVLENIYRRKAVSFMTWILFMITLITFMIYCLSTSFFSLSNHWSIITIPNLFRDVIPMLFALTTSLTICTFANSSVTSSFMKDTKYNYFPDWSIQRGVRW